MKQKRLRIKISKKLVGISYFDVPGIEGASNDDKAMLALELIKSCKPKNIELDLTSRKEAEDWLLVYILEMG